MAKIMIVDDSKMIRNALRIFLEAGNHEIVFEAKNGLEAVAAYIEHKPDLVTMDISMPEMDGVEAVRRIITFDQNAKIIMMSAVNQKEMVLEALKNGAQNYLLKPVTKEKVNLAVNQIMGNT
ncbi:MAG: response regulator [bacterium]